MGCECNYPWKASYENTKQIEHKTMSPFGWDNGRPSTASISQSAHHAYLPLRYPGSSSINAEATAGPQVHARVELGYG